MTSLYVNKPIFPAEPRVSTAQPRKRADYPHVPTAYLDAAKRLSHPMLMGPPLCDELIALVQHLFTEEEAALVRRLRPFVGRSPEAVARAERRRADDVAATLLRLADERGAIVRIGSDARPKYALMPIMPGMFEMILIRCPAENMTAWHRRFAELFEALYETGYILDYSLNRSAPLVRYLPVGGAVDVHPLALPTDKLEVILDQYDVFGIGPCQCRLTTQAVGRGCGKPVDNCLLVGQWAEQGIARGIIRGVPRHEALAIKREAETHGMVNWMMNVGTSKGQSSCTCCGCCCHAMRTISEFNAPGLFAPPHFLPALADDKCTYCGKCVRICPMKAIAIDAGGGESIADADQRKDSLPTTPRKSWRHAVERCVGCGLCAVHCDRQKAIAMQPAPAYRKPYRSWFSLMLHAAPGMVRGIWQAWRKRP